MCFYQLNQNEMRTKDLLNGPLNRLHRVTDFSTKVVCISGAISSMAGERPWELWTPAWTEITVLGPRAEKLAPWQNPWLRIVLPPH